MVSQIGIVVIFFIFIIVKIKNYLRNPDLTLYGPDKKPYLKRWWLIPKGRFGFNIYLHQFLSSDEDRALHSHPWASLSIILNRPYLEHLPKDYGTWIQNKDRREIVKKRYPLIPIYRGANNIHRIEMIDELKPVWTIFMTGPKIQEWGFYCPKGFKHHKEFLNVDQNSKGIGCGD